MKKILTLIAGTALTAGLLISCRGNMTGNGENGSDSIEFNTDSMQEMNINAQTNGNSQNEVSDEEAIAFIEEFYKPDADGYINWDEKELQKYLSAEVVKELHDDFPFGDDDSWAENEQYATWNLLATDPVGDLDLLNVSKAEATGDGRYEKRFTTAHWANHSQSSTSSLFYTVERIDGNLKITKVEDIIR